jgi:hypothetical protein
LDYGSIPQDEFPASGLPVCVNVTADGKTGFSHSRIARRKRSKILNLQDKAFCGGSPRHSGSSALKRIRVALIGRLREQVGSKGEGIELLCPRWVGGKNHRSLRCN